LALDRADMNGLELWRRVLVSSVRSKSPDLSQRQLSVMLTVYLTPAPHTVRGLAATLGVTKPVITRALDKLSVLEFIRRKTDEADRRNVLVQRTVKGAVFLSEFAKAIAACREAALPSETSETS
jgi:DNA-binding MarR family transcriptional regulator